ncbi:MAG: hypothetical protein KME17_07325 [Cyanosarcina radialis HA8281-LM2]|jgi:hypothetical protein|nr:hypothetical protein [Cyanosarcina radialis HA8281-LM2]
MKSGSDLLFSPLSLLRFYLWLLGTALLLQGTISLLLILANIEPLEYLAKLLTSDRLHAAIHIGWGMAILGLLKTVNRDRFLAGLGFAFGGFYLMLGVLGAIAEYPLGMTLRWSEDLFHLVVGPVALLLSWKTLTLKGDRHYTQDSGKVFKRSGASNLK